MRTLRYIVLALLFLLLVVVVVGVFLPSKVHLQRSVSINRGQTDVFNVINSLSDFNKWSPWYELDVGANYVLSGAASGVGSKLQWQGNNKVGSGSNEIVESVQNSYIKTKFFFGKSEDPAFSKISLQAEGNSTKVTWSFDNDFGFNIFYRYFGLVLEDMIAPDYEKGLSKLKKYVESLPLYDYSNISIVVTEPEPIYVLAGQINLAEQDVSTEIAKAYKKIVEFLTQNKLSMNGSPKIITLKFENNVFDYLAAIPVLDNSINDESGLIKSNQMYQGKAIKLVYKGSYNNFKQQYNIINAYIVQNQLQRDGNSWEDFITDPAEVTEDELITHIYQPIK